jgi:NADH:ubiquinone oxidoreductase subunit 5 (subunit L)/multisubunit Na+/H+ antiporter MnhA subunit
MFLAILFLPLLTAILAGFAGRYLGRKGACVLTIGGMVLVLLTSYQMFFSSLTAPTIYHLKLGT